MEEARDAGKGEETMVSPHKLQPLETKRGGSFGHPHIPGILHCA